MTVPYAQDEAWQRACRLITFMSKYIGKMAPGGYANLYVDLNEHFIAAGRTPDPDPWREVVEPDQRPAWPDLPRDRP